MKQLLLCTMLLARSAAMCQTATDIRASNERRETPKVETGIASYYNSKFKGKPTASGELYDPDQMTAAHNNLPMGTRIRVTNIRNRRSVEVVVNDRLHFRNKRLVDLSRAAARKLGYTGRGLARVRVTVLDDD